MRNESFSIALVGCGKMGGALLKGWLDNPAIEAIHVLEPTGIPDEFANAPKIKSYIDAHIFNTGAKNLSAIVLAVKPQVIDRACASVAPAVKENVVVISIAAGKKLDSLAPHFNPGQPIIRAMPNTPASIGQGISVAIAGKNAKDAHKNAATQLLSAAGKLEWIEDESLFDAVTAVSGSGPAYVFLLIETLTKAGIQQGLDAAFAERLARQTVIGSAALAAHESGTSALQLRQNVTSPGGTTAAALEILMNGSFQKLFDDAIAAATKRGKELSQS